MSVHPDAALAGRSAAVSLHQLEKRLALLDDVRGEFGRVSSADVPGRVNRTCGDEEHLAGSKHDRGPALDLVLEGPFEHPTRLERRSSGDL